MVFVKIKYILFIGHSSQESNKNYANSHIKWKMFMTMRKTFCHISENQRIISLAYILQLISLEEYITPRRVHA